MKRFYYLLLLGMTISLGCKTGEELENQLPETKIFLDKIELTGTDRLNSVVNLHWSGEDPDGYVSGYEFSFDAKNWVKTQRQDSVFRFDIAVGSDTLDIPFYVRAIDNRDAKDASPAFLSIPIKNTPPTVKLSTTKSIPDTVFSVFTFEWESSDLDGKETLDSIFIRLNNGGWYGLSTNTDLLSIVPSAPMQAGSQTAKCYKNFNAQQLTLPITGLKVEDYNKVYIRARDIAGSWSEVDSSNSFWLRRQTGDVLVLDEYASTATPSPEEVYLPILQNLGVSYDLYDLSRLSLPYWQPTLQLWMGLYDKVFWYGEGKEYADYGTQMYLEVGANALQTYLNQGGKLLISTKFPPRFNVVETAYNSPIFGYSPFDSLSTSMGFARLWTDSTVYAVNSFAGNFPNLKPSANGNVDAAYAKNPTQNLYDADLQKTNGWVGPNTICGTTKFTNNRTNQIFFTVDLHKLNGDPAAFDQMFNKIFNQELNW